MFRVHGAEGSRIYRYPNPPGLAIIAGADPAGIPGAERTGSMRGKRVGLSMGEGAPEGDAAAEAASEAAPLTGMAMSVEDAVTIAEAGAGVAALL